MTGGVRSMLRPPTAALSLLPALSIAVPVTLWLEPSVLTVVSGVLLKIPEVASLLAKCTVTGPLFQPYGLAAVTREPVIEGGVPSMFTGIDFWVSPFATLSLL